MDTFADGRVVFRPGPIYQCAKLGGFGILDEINMARNEALAVLHSALDFRRCLDVPGYDRLPMEDGTRFIATMNYGYAGTRELGLAEQALCSGIHLGCRLWYTAGLTADRKDCRRFGPCGAGKLALYLNSFYLDCRYYIPYGEVERVFKRVAMSSGGFSHRGVFASIPYLVVEYGGGKQKQCNFKYEDQVDQLLEYLSKLRPSIPRVSREGEARLAKRERERSARALPELTERAGRSVKLLQKAEAYLEERPDLTGELSRSAREKRAYLRSKPGCRYVALAVMAAGVLALVYGLCALTRGADKALYFLLFGLAAVFMFSGANVLPTSRNNRKAVFSRAEKAQTAMEAYLKGFPRFPLPPRYAHPAVLRRMRRALEEGRAENPEGALEVVKADLKALNSSVEVDQEEYDEVVAIKPMFLNEDYQ